MTQCCDSVIIRRQNTYKKHGIRFAISEQKVIQKWSKTKDLDVMIQINPRWTCRSILKLLCTPVVTGFAICPRR